MAVTAFPRVTGERMMTPPVFSFREPKMGRVARICLIGSALLHLVPAIIILIRFSWIPNGMALLPFALLGFGVASLWASPPVLAALGALNALAFCGLSAVGAMNFGNPHGADVLFFGMALLPLANALMLGYAFGAVRKTRVPNPKRSVSASGALIWTSGVVLFLIALWIGGFLFREKSHSMYANKNRGFQASSLPTRTGEMRKEEDREAVMESGDPEASEYQKAFLDAVLRRARLAGPRASEPGVTSGDGSYLSTAEYRDEGDIYDGPVKPSSLSCRSTLLQTLLPQVISQWPGKREFHFSGSLQGDSLFQSFGCREFPQDRQFYGLVQWPEWDSAYWRPMIPQYSIDIQVRAYWGDSARWANGSINPDSLLEDAWVDFKVWPVPKPIGSWSQDSWSGMILQSASEVDTLPFAYFRYPFKGALNPNWNADNRMLTLRTETGDMSAGAFKSLVWTQQFEIPPVVWPESDNSTFHGAELSGTTGDGRTVILAAGNTVICKGDLKFHAVEGAAPVLEPGREEPSPVILSDIDRDGRREILLESRILGKRWIFIRENGDLFEMIIRPTGKQPSCC